MAYISSDTQVVEKDISIMSHSRHLKLRVRSFGADFGAGSVMTIDQAA